jgi:hypothetical protein
LLWREIPELDAVGCPENLVSFRLTEAMRRWIERAVAAVLASLQSPPAHHGPGAQSEKITIRLSPVLLLQYRYTPAGMATTLKSWLVALTEGSVYPRNEIWNGRRRKAPETPPMEVKNEMAHATRDGTQGETSMPDVGKNTQSPSCNVGGRLRGPLDVAYYALTLPKGQRISSGSRLEPSARAKRS